MGRLELSCLEVSTEMCLSSKNMSPCGSTSLCIWKAEFLNSVNDREFGFQPFFMHEILLVTSSISWIPHIIRVDS